MKLTLAKRNAHFGARYVELSDHLTYDIVDDNRSKRHFLKEEVPRIAYVNPSLVIEVERKEKTKEENWDPELVVQFGMRITSIQP